MRTFDLWHWFASFSVSRRALTTVAHRCRYGLLDDKVKFLRGFFSDTLPKAPIEKLSVIRLDGEPRAQCKALALPATPLTSFALLACAQVTRTRAP